jgi:RND family efflux transporter MFP subunit
MAKLGAVVSGKSLISVLLIYFLTSACSRGAPPVGGGKPQGIPVKLQTVESSMVEESNEYNGDLEAEHRVDLKPEAEGRVVQIFVSSGSRVERGIPIVQLRPDKNQAQLGGAIANINAAQASLNNAQAQLKAVEADLVSAAAEVALQNQQFQRISSLVSQGALAKQQLDQVKRDRDRALAAKSAVEEKIRAARATIDQQNAALSSAQANATMINEELKETRVLAPIPGVVGDVTVKVGDYVKTDQTLTTIIQNQSLNVSLKIPTERSSQLRVGLPVELRGFTDTNLLATGRISFVSPQVNPQEQLVQAKANFPNPEGNLRDAQKVRAKVIWRKKPGVLIPNTAVSYLAGKPFVYVAQNQETSQLIARQKTVKLGEINGNNRQVIEGLQAGEKVIISGLLNLKDGAPIIPEP